MPAIPKDWPNVSGRRRINQKDEPIELRIRWGWNTVICWGGSKKTPLWGNSSEGVSRGPALFLKKGKKKTNNGRNVTQQGKPFERGLKILFGHGSPAPW